MNPFSSRLPPRRAGVRKLLRHCELLRRLALRSPAWAYDRCNCCVSTSSLAHARLLAHVVANFANFRLTSRTCRLPARRTLG